MSGPRRKRRVLLRAAIALLLLMVCPLLGGRAEAAISCTLTGPTLTFGTINIFSSSTTSGNATLTCTTTGQPQTFYACLSIGTGTGGTTATNRTLASGSNMLPIQITGGATWPSQIGNGTSYPMEGVVNFSVPRQSSGSYTFPVVVTIPTPASLPPAGTYASTFTGADFQVYWDMNFGSASLLTAALSATAQVSVSCNAILPVTIALDNGAAGTGPTSRLMTAGTHTIQYGIYKDGAHSQPWGNTVGVNTASGTGPSATLTAYGQVPAQSPAPTPGSYADVVGVTVTY